MHGRHLPLQVKGVIAKSIAKSIDVLDPVGCQVAKDSRVNDKSLGLNLLEHTGMVSTLCMMTRLDAYFRIE